MSEGRKNSHIWQYFTTTATDNKNASCNICKRVISFKSTITNLKSHLKRVHPIQFTSSLELNCSSSELPEQAYVEPSTFNTVNVNTHKSQSQTDTSSQVLQGPYPSTTVSSQNISSKKRCQKEITSFIPRKLRPEEKHKIDQSLMTLFTKDFQPFTIIEDEGFKEFVHRLNPSYSLPSRKLVSNTMLLNMFDKSVSKIKSYVKEQGKVVCITTDNWTSRNTESFIAVTIHFINDDFKLISVLLDCTVMFGSHTGQQLSTEILRILEEWDLKDKVIMGVSDNASNICSAFEKYLLYDHFGCYAHSLNLVIQDAVLLFNVTITKIKRIVVHFKKSSKSSEQLCQYQLRNNVTNPKRLIQCVPTRWNSVYYMLKRFVELKESVRATMAIIDTDLPVITGEEWEACEQLCEVLEPFEDATRAISGEQYLTGSLPIVLTKGLFIVCDQLQNQPYSDLVKQIVQKLDFGLRFRFGNLEENDHLTLSTFLDPRFKQHYFTDKTAELVISRVRNLLVAEIESSVTSREECSDDETNIENNTEQVPSQSKKSKTISVWQAVDLVVQNKKPKRNPLSKADKELDLYLETNLLKRKSCPLTWWKEHKLYFPDLSKIFRSKCGIVTTSVPCERIFSKTGNILSDRRCSLKCGKVRQIVFLNANNHLL